MSEARLAGVCPMALALFPVSDSSAHLAVGSLSTVKPLTWAAQKLKSARRGSKGLPSRRGAWGFLDNVCVQCFCFIKAGRSSGEISDP